MLRTLLRFRSRMQGRIWLLRIFQHRGTQQVEPVVHVRRESRQSLMLERMGMLLAQKWPIIIGRRPQVLILYQMPRL